MADSKLYTIPLRREFSKASYKRKTNKAVKALREYVFKHTKADRVVIGEELNDQIWARGITNPPAKVKVEITKETVKKDNEDIVEAYVNLVGLKRKVVEQKKKNIISKEGSGLKDKLQSAVDTLKGSDKEEKPEQKKEEETPVSQKKEKKPVESKKESVAPKENKESSEKKTTKKSE